MPLLSGTGQAPRALPPLVRDIAFYDGSWRRVAHANAVYYGLVTPLDSGRCRTQNYCLRGEPANVRSFDSWLRGSW